MQQDKKICVIQLINTNHELFRYEKSRTYILLYKLMSNCYMKMITKLLDVNNITNAEWNVIFLNDIYILSSINIEIFVWGRLKKFLFSK